ncbi:MAG: hypothetical protein ACK40G_17140 [Cytophagaceae bacterium]
MEKKRKYYIVREEKELKIVVVYHEEEFLEDYKGKIICSGDSLQEVMIEFSKRADKSGQ